MLENYKRKKNATAIFCAETMYIQMVNDFLRQTMPFWTDSLSPHDSERYKRLLDKWEISALSPAGDTAKRNRETEVRVATRSDDDWEDIAKVELLKLAAPCVT